MTTDLHALGVVERTGSVLSLLGTLFIITTFLLSPAFHKPINRLVFYASFGNGIVNAATLMATSYVGAPSSAGCQAQAFLIQWLMPADALWTLSMAVNVYLKFYRKYDAAALRRVEVVYLAACYGIPFLPALVYLLVQNGEGDKVYGNAGLWCWISKPWAMWRILSFYGPIWLVILSTLFIYFRTGIDIYRNHRELRQLSRTELETNASSTWVNTEITITSEAVSKPSPLPQNRNSGSSSLSPEAPPQNDVYSVSVTASSSSRRRPTTPAALRRSVTRAE